jgi:hypothetical protein
LDRIVETNNKNKKNYLKWLIPLLIVILTAGVLHVQLIRIIAVYGFKIFYFAIIAVVFYAFAGIFTKKIWLKWILTICIYAGCFLIHYEVNNYHPRAVQMKEDVLYILPKLDTTKK